jgi:hypothetical protein
MSHNRIPKLSHHKASGKAVVRLCGIDHYLGPWGSCVARNEYDRVIAEWLAGGRQSSAAEAVSLTVAEILAAFWDYAKDYYRHADGTPTTEILSFRDAFRPLRRLYGHTPAAAFGPLALKAVRLAMIDAGLCRTNVNCRIGRIKRVFKWAVENEMIPANVFHGLQAVSGLKAGRSGVRESDPVKPVPEELVNATLPFVSRQVGAMIRLQQITGMRPGEVVVMRGVDMDTTGSLWTTHSAARSCVLPAGLRCRAATFLAAMCGASRPKSQVTDTQCAAMAARSSTRVNEPFRFPKCSARASWPTASGRPPARGALV